MLSNQRGSFDEVEGEVRFGNMDHNRAKQYRQQITFNTEGLSLYTSLAQENGS